MWIGDYRTLTVPSSTAQVLTDMSQLIGAVAYSANTPGLGRKVRVDRIIMQTSTRRLLPDLTIKSVAWGIYNANVNAALDPIQFFDPTTTDPDRAALSNLWHLEQVDIPGTVLDSLDAPQRDGKVMCATSDFKPRRWLDRSTETLQLAFTNNDVDVSVSIDFRFRLLIHIP